MTDDHKDLNRKMGAGIAWVTAARLAVRGLGVISTVILARLLAPADFGIVAMATSLIALLELASSFSFDISLIQKLDSKAEDYHTAWTLNVAFAVGLGLLLMLVAPAAARFYHEPRLPLVIYCLGTAFMIQGFQNIGIVAFRRDLQFHKDFALMVAQKVAGVVVTIPLAFWLQNYWALVAGSVVNALASVGMSYAVHPFRPRFSLAASRDLFRFSGWLLLQNVIAFIRGRSADFAIGRLAGPAALGLFEVAYEIANLPTSELVAPINRAVFPGYARMAHDTGQLRRAFSDVLGFIAVIILPVGLGLAAVAEPLVAVFLGPRWSDAVPLVQILGIAGALLVLQTNTASVYNALGKPRFMVFTGVIQVVFLLPLLIAGIRGWGSTGAAWVFLLHGVVIGMPSTFLMLLKTTPVQWRDVWQPVWRALLAAAAMYGSVRLAGYALADVLGHGGFQADAMRLAASVLLGVGVYVGSLALLWLAAGRPDGAEAFLLRRARLLPAG